MIYIVLSFGPEPVNMGLILVSFSDKILAIARAEPPVWFDCFKELTETSHIFTPPKQIREIDQFLFPFRRFRLTLMEFWRFKWHNVLKLILNGPM